ncbi:MAG: TonB-dependent receptor [Flavobacterium sp.]|jgi:hypothetical protein|nr:TonB-dependent receptor [Flavobacterium sp.]
MKLKFLIITLFICVLGFSQNKGTISGILTDKDSNNQPLPFANVLIKGTKTGVNTDLDGKYSIAVTPGNYILQFSFVGYESLEVPVTVKADEKVTVNRTLGSGSYKLEDVVIKATAPNREKETALLLDQKQAVVIKQSIGAQEMARKGASDVAAAVTKTTGITKQEGSGNIYVRGLGDRYNSTTMNGLPIPSNNPSKKNIRLDIFTTDIVESIGIDKTFNFRNFGDFAGANIDIVSKSYSGKGMLEFGLDFGVNSQAINQDKFYLQDGPSKTGFSKINYPDNPLNGYNFTTKWNKETATPVNSAFFLRGGNSFNVGENGKIGFFATAAFDSDYSYRNGVSNGSVNVQGVARRNFKFETFNYGTNTTLMANVNYKINSNNSLLFNSMFINSSSQDHKEYKGIIDIFDNASEGGGFVRRSSFDKTAMYINQVLGKHKFNEKINMNWGVSLNTIKNNVPDRMTNTLTPVDNSNLDVLQVANNNDSENNRFFQDLKEDELSANFAVDYKFKKDEEGNSKGKLTVGYSGRFKTIAFKATQFNFDINTSVTQPIVDINNIDGYFNQANYANGLFAIKTFNGGLKPQTFDGDQYVNAGFFALEYNFTPKLTVILSTRAESIYQKINWFTNLSPLGSNEFDKLEILPSTNIKYELSDRQNLKFAASKTYTLPQFKERAPFQFEDATETTFGNPDLYLSTDYNADIKWEFFPKSNEVISVTAFGKLIQNPINEITVASATNDISYVNTGEKAIAIGGEFEIRKNIFEIDSDNKENLTAGFNASYMYNNQDFDGQKVTDETNLSVFFSNKEGKLTGASDLLLNSDISYFKEFSKERNLLATLTYNYFSDRIYALGTSERGNLVDKAVGTLDFILRSKITKNIGLGLTVKNILDPTIERIQDKQNVLVESYKKGTNFKFSVTYKF